MAIHLSGLPGEHPLSGAGRAARLPRLALLRVGFTEPAGSPPPLVRSYRTLSPLPVRAEPAIGGFLSVALSCGSPRLAASQHPALRSPDLPRCGPALATRTAATWPTHRPHQSATWRGHAARVHTAPGICLREGARQLLYPGITVGRGGGTPIISSRRHGATASRPRNKPVCA